MEAVKNLRELIKNYRQGFELEEDMTPHSEAWIKGFYHAFDTVDSIIEEFLYGI